MEKISQEAYQKALETLNLVPGKTDEAAALIKAEEEKKAADLKKAEEDKAAADAKEAKQKEIKELLEKAEALQKELGIEPTTSVQTDTATIINKAEIVSEIMSGVESQFKALGTLIINKDHEIAELKKGIETANEFNSILGRRIGILEKQPLDRKSVNTESFVDRFEKGGDTSKPNMKVLSLRKADERAEIVEVLFNEIEMEGGRPKSGAENSALIKAVRNIESMGKIADVRDGAQFINHILERLKKSNIKVVE